MRSFAILVSFCLLVQVSIADTLSDKQRQVNTIRRQINRYQQQLANDSGKRTTMQLELKRHNQNIQRLEKQKADHRQHLRKLDRQQRQLQQQIIKLEKLRHHQNELLGKTLKHHYYLGNPSPLKLFLNAQDPSQWQRYWHYQKVIYGEQMKQLQTLQATLNELKSKRDQVKKLQQQAQTVKVKQQQIIQKLRLSNRENAKVITALNQQISDKKRRLQHLKSAHQEMDSLIKMIRQYPSDPSSHRAFGSMRSKLPWPTPGKILSHYEFAPKQGAFIAAPAGQAVRAIFPGKIIFAGWMKSFGLLTIIEHNTGYLSIYAYNRGLFKKLGEKVTAGEKIAEVGQTGGNLESGLYFEIRHRGKPENPRHWCRQFA